MKHRMNYFGIGSSYYPPMHGSEDWERDVVNMEKAGLNMIRTAELITSWDYIEPQKGKPEWDWLDHIFELSSQHGIEVVLGTGSCNAPIWMIDEYPDLQRVSREGVKYPTNTVWGWACVNNPGLRTELARYLTLMLERYSEHASLYCWQIDNQIGMHTAYSQAEVTQPRRYGYYCYCDHCANLFREWVKAKYKNIDVLNDAWCWDPTHPRYHDWKQIQPPRSMPAEWGNGTAWLDFRIFTVESLANFVRYQHDLIKAFDEKQLTMHNLYNCLRESMGARQEPNHWDIGSVPDIIGHDIYPSEDNYKTDPAYSSWFLDFAYSVAHHHQKTMWIPELESGPLGGFSAGPNYATTALDIKRFNIACIGHGAKCLLYQGYRDWNSIPLTWGALVDFHGEPTGRYHAASDVCKVVDANKDFFLDALPPQAQVALYHTHENVLALDGQSNEEFFYHALRGVHSSLWHHNYTTQFIEPRFLGNETANYNVIFMPFVMYLPKEVADKLTEFVNNGGTLIGFAKLGHLDDKGWAWNDRPGAGLHELFGALETHIEVFKEPHDNITLKVDRESPLFEGIEADTINGYWHYQEWDLQDDVEVMAEFMNGSPAIIRRKVGKGQTILMGTHMDMAVAHHKDPNAMKLFDNLMQLCGVTKDLITTGTNQDYVNGHVDAHLLSHGNQHAVLITNEGVGQLDVTVRLPGKSASTATELFTNTAVELRQNDGVEFSIGLEPTDAVVVMLA